MRLFGGDQVARLMTVFNLPEDTPLEHPMVSRAIEQAQTKVEGFHFDSRKHLVEYDDVLNRQREIVYKRRKNVLEGESQKDVILTSLSSHLGTVATLYGGEAGAPADTQKLVAEFTSIIPFDEASQKRLADQLAAQRGADVGGFLFTIAKDMYEHREKHLGEDVMRQVERWVSLTVIDNLWMNHLDAIDDLREGIGLRGYGGRDPLVEYKNEAFNMFERLLASIDAEIVSRIFKVQVAMPPAQQAAPAPAKPQAPPAQAEEKKLGRNDPCWCGSGKKWKKCHLSSGLA